MAFAIKDTLQAIQGHLSASGYLPRAQISEPKNAPTEQIAAAVFLNSATLGSKAYLNGQVEERHLVTVRLYMNMMHEPAEEIEYRLSEAVGEITDDFLGDFSLGANVREIDYAGMNGTPMSVNYGYTDIGGKIFRVADITLPLNVDNAVTISA